MAEREFEAMVAVGLSVVLTCGALVGCSSSDSPPRPSGTDAGAGGAPDDNPTGGSGPMVVCDPSPVVIDPTAIIDDMEDRNGNLTLASGRNGTWWTATDETPGGTIEPSQPIPEAIPGSRCGSEYAMRVTGQGFDDWGSILGLNFAYGPDEDGVYGSVPHDAHFRQGIRFWARVGDTSTRQVRFNLADFHAVTEAGWCVEGGTPACFTYEATLSQIDTTWKQYTIPFAGLVHATPANPNEPADPSLLYGMNFYFHTSAVFDFWIDDLEFY